MSEIHLRQPVFICNGSWSFTKYKLKELGDLLHIYQNELDKVCFQHGMPNRDSEDLNRRTCADKILHYKAFNIAKDPK